MRWLVTAVWQLLSAVDASLHGSLLYLVAPSFQRDVSDPLSQSPSSFFSARRDKILVIRAHVSLSSGSSEFEFHSLFSELLFCVLRSIEDVHRFS